MVKNGERPGKIYRSKKHLQPTGRPFPPAVQYRTLVTLGSILLTFTSILGPVFDKHRESVEAVLSSY
jgi:hypothetical protein